MGVKKTIHNLIVLMKKEKKIPVVEVKQSDRLLDGKTALITGGTGGIGKEIARVFLNAGAKVVLVGRNVKKLQQTKEELQFEEHVKTLSYDIAKMDEIPQMAKAAFDSFDDKRVDILVNAAGIIDSTDFLHVTEETFDKVIATNLKATYFVSQAVSRQMIEKGIKGHILNVSSSSAIRPASTPYQLSKWGINGLTKGMAEQLLPYGIVVNAVGPGPTATTMLGVNSEDGIDNYNSPSKRYVLPEEVANVALMLVSGAGDMIVGETYYITGGSATISMGN